MVKVIYPPEKPLTKKSTPTTRALLLSKLKERPKTKPAKRKTTKREIKLNPLANALMAAIMGISNMGQDQFFKTNRAGAYGHRQYTPEQLAKDYERYKNATWAHTPRDYCKALVDGIAGSLMETDEMQGWFHQEATSWIPKLKEMSAAKIKSTWPDYAGYVDVLLAGASNGKK